MIDRRLGAGQAPCPPIGPVGLGLGGPALRILLTLAPSAWDARGLPVEQPEDYPPHAPVMGTHSRLSFDFGGYTFFW